MLADILKCKVDTIESKEGPALGAAILAGVACGMFNSVEEGCAKFVVRGSAKSVPDEVQTKRYDAIFALYSSNSALAFFTI